MLLLHFIFSVWLKNFNETIILLSLLCVELDPNSNYSQSLKLKNICKISIDVDNNFLFNKKMF